jgi:hypothetical protein
MTKIALTAAAILIATGTAFAVATGTAFAVATGTAFAGSDNFGSNNANQPAAPVASADNTVTTSIEKPDATVQQPVTQRSNRDLFGNR